MDKLDVVTIGESMVVFNPMQNVSFTDSHLFMKQIAGAESNLAIGLSRLNHKVGWISRVSDNSFGNYINYVLRGNGVDTRMVQFDDENPTGLLIKEKVMNDQTNVHYYRNHSAASYMQPSIVDEAYFFGAKYLFITGITPALSDTCKQTIYEAIDVAKKLGTKIVFDPNVRYKLIKDVDEYKQTLNDIASKSDFFLPGETEIAFLSGYDSKEESAKYFLTKNPDLQIVIKLGAKGCCLVNTHEEYHVPGYKVEHIVDPIGAGDAFSAGLISGLLEGKELKDSLDQANLLGAMVIQTSGDVEGFPYKNQLEEYKKNFSSSTKEEVNR